jgi:hypothetical protein
MVALEGLTVSGIINYVFSDSMQFISITNNPIVKTRLPNRDARGLTHLVYFSCGECF